jgi:hypothetical protein
MQFTYENVGVKALSADSRLEGGRYHARSVKVGDRECKTTRRFWNSFHGRFRIAPNVYNYYDHNEVFQRIGDRTTNQEIRVTIREPGDGFAMPELLAISSPKTPIMRYRYLAELMGKLGVKDLQYDNGSVTTQHAPRIGTEPFKIGADEFVNRFTLDTPIDGWGKPAVYVSLLRLICTNGAIGYHPCFRSEINLGQKNDTPTYAIERAIQNYNSEEGFTGIRQRFESAMNSWSSLRETRRLGDVVDGLHRGKNFNTQIGDERWELGAGGNRLIPSRARLAFENMTGDMRWEYGLTNLDTVTTKRSRLVPTKARVMDLINYASELATHHVNEGGSRALQAWIGETIGQEYDLEGTGLKFPEFKDFFLQRQTELTEKDQSQKDSAVARLAAARVRLGLDSAAPAPSAN